MADVGIRTGFCKGISGGMIGVVIPLYLAECLAAANRGKGTGIFQLFLTLGIVAAAVIGFYFSGRVEQVAKLGDPQKLFQFKDTAWRGIFWVSLPPGVLFVLGAFMVAESPRWFFRRGKKDAALRALQRSSSEEQATMELREMEAIAVTEKSSTHSASKHSGSLLQRKYILPFVLACIILACNQATGVNSIIGYNATILIQAGLSDKQAHLGYVFLTIINSLMTFGGIAPCRSQGQKISPFPRQRGNHCLAARRGNGFPPIRGATRGGEERSTGNGERHQSDGDG